MSVSISDVQRRHQPKRRDPDANRRRLERRPGAHRAAKPLELPDLSVGFLAVRRQAARVISSW